VLRQTHTDGAWPSVTLLGPPSARPWASTGRGRWIRRQRALALDDPRRRVEETATPLTRRHAGPWRRSCSSGRTPRRATEVCRSLNGAVEIPMVGRGARLNVAVAVAGPVRPGGGCRETCRGVGRRAAVSRRRGRRPGPLEVDADDERNSDAVSPRRSSSTSGHSGWHVGPTASPAGSRMCRSGFGSDGDTIVKRRARPHEDRSATHLSRTQGDRSLIAPGQRRSVATAGVKGAGRRRTRGGRGREARMTLAEDRVVVGDSTGRREALRRDRRRREVG